LTIPTTIPGDERGIIALAWNDANSFIGILSENVLVNGATKHLVEINLQDYSVTELGITFTEDTITSMLKVGTHIYVATWFQGFLDIDTTTNSVTNINSINGSRLAQISATELGFLQASTTSTNVGVPSVITLPDLSVTPSTDVELYSLVNIFGGTVFANQTYLNLVATNSIYLGILKTDFDSGESTLTTVNSMSADRNVVILTTRPTN